MAGAALLALADASADAHASSKAAARLYEQACVEGQFRLDHKHGALVKAGDIPADIRGPSIFNRKVGDGQYVKMFDPPRTYLQLISYANPKPGTEATECTLASLVLDFDDAADIFSKNAEATPVYRNFGDDTRWWVIDVPGHGYRKYLSKQPRGWVVLQTVTYESRH